MDEYLKKMGVQDQTARRYGNWLIVLLQQTQLTSASVDAVELLSGYTEVDTVC